LPHQGGGSHGKAKAGHIGYGFGNNGQVVGGVLRRPQAQNDGSKDHLSAGHYYPFATGGQADFNDAPNQAPIGFQSEAEPHPVPAGKQDVQHDNAGYSPGSGGGNGSAGHAQSCPGNGHRRRSQTRQGQGQRPGGVNQEDVADDIEDVGQHVYLHGRLGIPGAPQHTVEDKCGKGKDKSHAEDPQVGGSHRNDFGLGPHDDGNQGSKSHNETGNQQGQGHAHQQGLLRSFVCTLPVPRSGEAGHQRSGTHSQGGEEPVEQVQG